MALRVEALRSLSHELQYCSPIVVLLLLLLQPVRLSLFLTLSLCVCVCLSLCLSPRRSSLNRSIAHDGWYHLDGILRGPLPRVVVEPCVGECDASISGMATVLLDQRVVAAVYTARPFVHSLLRRGGGWR